MSLLRVVAQIIQTRNYQVKVILVLSFECKNIIQKNYPLSLNISRKFCSLSYKKTSDTLLRTHLSQSPATELFFSAFESLHH